MRATLNIEGEGPFSTERVEIPDLHEMSVNVEFVDGHICSSCGCERAYTLTENRWKPVGALLILRLRAVDDVYMTIYESQPDYHLEMNYE